MVHIMADRRRVPFEVEYHVKPRTRAAGAENIAAIAPDKPLPPESGG
jgi:hypothetical protein